MSKPETLTKAQPLYAYFHQYESQFGELSQIAKLEQRMAELFPQDPKLASFAARYSTKIFNPVAAPIIISKAVQMRPRASVLPPVNQVASTRGTPLPFRQEISPRPQYARVTASPKRPLGIDDDELNPPKRLARGVSPLKGAAGRRLDQQRRSQSSALHRDITFLLGILPPSHSYDAQRLNTNGMVSLLRETQIPDYNAWKLRASGRPASAATHSRQPSNETSNRPISPYGRLASASGGYISSPLRVEQPANPYAPPPSAGAVPMAWPPPPQAGYGQPPSAQFPPYRF